MDIIIYSSAFCPYCMRAKHLLDSKDLSYNEIPVQSPEDWEEVKQKSGRSTVPQIFIGERHIGGNDDLQALNRSGELDKIIAQMP